MDGLRPSIAPQLCKPLYFLKASHPAWLASAHTCLEEAALAFAACGITGPVVADLPYQTGDVPDASSGNIMGHLVGRTVASGDAIHSNTVFVLNLSQYGRGRAGLCRL